MQRGGVTWTKVTELEAGGTGSGADQIIDKTSTDTGTISAGVLEALQETPNLHIVYDGELYYRINPANTSDDTFNMIHIDSIQDSSGGYKATGKSFSITASTLAWKVVPINFVSHYAHQLKVADEGAGTEVYFTLINDDDAPYDERAVKLIIALRNAKASIAGIIKTQDGIFAAIVNAVGSTFKATYSLTSDAPTEYTMKSAQMTVQDYIS